MKLMLITEKDSTKNILGKHLSPRNIEIIHYRNPIKALDNIEEVEPQLVIFNAQDFPRHWKPFLNLLRNEKSKAESVFILLIGTVFPFEEAAKAIHLGTNGIISKRLENRKELAHLDDLIKRYLSPNESREKYRYILEEYDKVDFIFTQPHSLQLVTGFIQDLSGGGLSFIPDSPSLILDLQSGEQIPLCSLMIEDSVLSIEAEIVRNDEILALKFLNLKDSIKARISDYINDKAKRALEAEKTRRKAQG